MYKEILRYLDKMYRLRKEGNYVKLKIVIDVISYFTTVQTVFIPYLPFFRQHQNASYMTTEVVIERGHLFQRL